MLFWWSHNFKTGAFEITPETIWACAGHFLSPGRVQPVSHCEMFFHPTCSLCELKPQACGTSCLPRKGSPVGGQGPIQGHQ